MGASLTGVGELILDTDGTLNLRPPSNGSQYFLSITDFDTLRGDQNSSAVWWKALAIGFALAGAAVLLWVGRRYYYHLKVCWEREQERREFERLQAEAPRTRSAVTGPEAHQDSTEDHIENACVICLSQPRNCILLDCGHVCCCHTCYQALPQRRCPICRQIISRVVPLYHVWTPVWPLQVVTQVVEFHRHTNCASFIRLRSELLHLHLIKSNGTVTI